MWAVAQRQMKGKFNILSMNCTAMQKGQALEPVSRRANLLNLNQISEMITNSDIDESQCDVAAMEDQEY
jgi:hypothetical protein